MYTTTFRILCLKYPDTAEVEGALHNVEAYPADPLHKPTEEDHLKVSIPNLVAPTKIILLLLRTDHVKHQAAQNKVQSGHAGSLSRAVRNSTILPVVIGSL